MITNPNTNDIPWIVNVIVNYVIKSRGIQKCHTYFRHVLESLDHISKLEIINNAKHISIIDEVMQIVIHRSHGQNKPILIILQENVFKTLTISPNSMIGSPAFLHRCVTDLSDVINDRDIFLCSPSLGMYDVLNFHSMLNSVKRLTVLDSHGIPIMPGMGNMVLRNAAISSQKYGEVKEHLYVISDIAKNEVLRRNLMELANSKIEVDVSKLAKLNISRDFNMGSIRNA